MTKIYLIRHAEAEGNLYRRIQGHFDGLITERGKKQILALAERFKNTKLDALYSSDLARTRLTSAAITKYHDLQPNYLESLREIHMGAWEDRAWGDVEYESPELLTYFSSDPDKWHVEGGEMFADVKHRMIGTVSSLAEKHEGQTIAVVSHGMAIRTLLCGAMGVPSADVSKVPHGDNTNVSLISVEDGRFGIEYFNDNRHLPSELSTFARQTWWKDRSGMDKNNLRFEAFDLKKEKELYISCYADSWKAAHNTLEGFDSDVYYKQALSHAKSHHMAIMKAMSGSNMVGLIEIDPERAKEHGAGWITLCYMLPEYRGKRLAVQLIGHAASLFRSLGRRSLRFHVAESNRRAIDFYKHYGFVQIGEEEGVLSKLILMEKEIVPEKM